MKIMLMGLAHSWIGIDHLCAALAVGLWSTQQSERKVWALPLVFIGAMTVGLMLADVSLPAVEPAILISVFTLGILIALSIRLGRLAGALILAIFALLHGHAHGTELPLSIESGAGLLLGTGVLHLLGVMLGLEVRHNTRLLRYVGSSIALLAVVSAL